MLNLLTNPWLPVLRRNGSTCVIAPSAITEDFADNPVIAIDWPRADFRIATLELLIGLLATACPPADEDDWLDAWETPPAPDALAAAFAPFAAAFMLDGDGPRFSQDFAPLEADEEPAENLLIEVAGNSGLLVHPGRIARLGRPAAAIALYTLQSWAPSGGRGNRTGLRGGGPLVSLVVPRLPKHATLWHRLWANVPLGRRPEPAAFPRIFPWLAPTITSEGSQVVTPEDVAHPLQAWWGMPRRIRLSFENLPAPAPCGLTGAADTVAVTGWRQRPYGPNYIGWGKQHPLTPTYQAKPGEEVLPLHPQPGGIGYRNWIGLVLSSRDGLRQPAPIISTWRDGRYGDTREARAARLLVAGYDMSNMKARGLLEAEMPLILAETKEAQDRLDALAYALVRASDQASRLLRQAVRQALFSPGSKVGTDAQAIASLGERLWLETEGAFFAALEAALTLDDTAPERAAWQRRLRDLALRLFDEAAPLEPLAKDNARQAKARRFLLFALNGYGKDGQAFFEPLELPLPAPAERPKGKAA